LTGVQISWGAVSGATSYDLLVDGSATVLGVTSPYTYSPGDSASHTYAVRAVNGCGNGSWSGVTSGTDADHSFTFAGIDSAADRDACDDSGVVIRWSTPSSWNDGGTGSRSFTVSRDGSTLTSGIGEAVTTIDDTTGTNGTSYTYSVEAFNGYGCSAGSSATASASDEVGGAPTFAGLQTVAGVPGGMCGLRLEWNAASSNCSGGPTVYNVYRSTTSGFTPNATTLLSSCIADLFYEDMGVTGGTTYYYVVRAEDASSGHGGPCGDGYEDGNTGQVSGLVGGGTAVQTVLFDDFEGSPTPSGHSWLGVTFSDSGNDGNDWETTTDRASNGTTSGHFGDGTGNTYVVNSDDGLLAGCDGTTGSCGTSGMNGIVIPAAATSVTLTFREWRDFENDYDGAMLMYSTTSATSGYSQVPDSDPGSGPFISAVSYDGTLGSYCPPSSATAGVEIWTGNTSSWQQVTVNLDDLAGQTIWLLWRAMTDCSIIREGWYVDEVQIQAEVPGSSCTTATADPVQHFTARATSGAVKLEWENPAGTYGSTRICVDTAAYPTDPSTCTVLVDRVGSAGAYDSYSYSGLTNTTTYYYSAFVDNGSAEYSAVQTVAARPFDTTAGQAKWAYNSSASSLAPPGLYPGTAGTGAAYGVSNDRVFHGMNSTTAGGDWPRTTPFAWMPMGMNGPAQERPPIVPTTVGTADLVAFLGSQDGHVYAVNAKTGVTLWQSATDFGLVQGSPAGMFTAFYGAYDLIFAGSRVAGAGNSIYAINPSDGSDAWSFGGSIGIISSAITVDYATNRLYFASRENSAGSTDTLWCVSFNASGATLVWSEAYGDIDSAPLLYDGVLYVGTNAGMVYAIDPATGGKYWAYATGDGPVKGYVNPEFTSLPRRLFFATTTTVWALTDSGTSVGLEWQQSGVAGPSIPLALADQGTVYVGSTNGSLYQLDATNGSVVTSEQLGSGSATIGSPGYDWANNLAYVGAEDGAVYAVVLPLQ
jgi:outer membrane protein assembly factor BamB